MRKDKHNRLLTLPFDVHRGQGFENLRGGGVRAEMPHGASRRPFMADCVFDCRRNLQFAGEFQAFAKRGHLRNVFFRRIFRRRGELQFQPVRRVFRRFGKSDGREAVRFESFFVIARQDDDLNRRAVVFGRPLVAAKFNAVLRAVVEFLDGGFAKKTVVCRRERGEIAFDERQIFVGNVVDVGKDGGTVRGDDDSLFEFEAAREKQGEYDDDWQF